MDRSSRKRCKKRLILFDSDSSSGSDEVKQLKCRKVLQRITPTRSSPVKKVNILENIQICPPSTAKSQNEIDIDSESDSLSSNKKYRKICNQTKQDNTLFISPSTGRKYGVLKNAEVQKPEFYLTQVCSHRLKNVNERITTTKAGRLPLIL